MRGVKNIWKPALGGVRIFYISFEGVRKFPHYLRLFALNVGGSNFFDFTREGVKIFSVGLRGGIKIFVMLFCIRPPPTAELYMTNPIEI